MLTRQPLLLEAVTSPEDPEVPRVKVRPKTLQALVKVREKDPKGLKRDITAQEPIDWPEKERLLAHELRRKVAARDPSLTTTTRIVPLPIKVDRRIQG